MKTIMFPGQGSQVLGMGGGLFDEFNELTKQADAILGYSIKELCLEDPRRELNRTQYTQPALYVVNALSWLKEAQRGGERPAYAVGHSLGEINALQAAECFSFEVGLEIVKKRGELLSRATGGGMAAIRNADEAKIRAVLNSSGLENIDLANFNTPAQIVISGLQNDIASSRPFLEKAGMEVFQLNTSGAFHSRYMEPAREEFESYLRKFEFQPLKIPVIANVSAQPYQDSDIVKNLSRQISGPVRWCEAIQYLLRQQDMEFQEIGHSAILSKMLLDIKARMSDVTTAPPAAIEKDVIHVKAAQPVRAPVAAEMANFPAARKVELWNEAYGIGTRVKSLVVEGVHETRTEATVLFGHRAAVYLKGFKGYFDLDEISVI